MTKPLRLLYNQDCTTLFYSAGPVGPEQVEDMVDEVAAAGVDVLLLNANLQRVNYQSAVWQTLWDGYQPGDRAFFGPVPDDDIALRDNYVSKMKTLADSGYDYLSSALRRCRERGVQPGLSIRMNDMHDHPWPGSHLFSDFYKSRPELRLSNPSHLGWATTGLNYANREVRDHYLRLIKEFLARYDFEVLELDFLRFPQYFPRNGKYREHADVMTAFVREVRNLLDGSSGRKELTCRVAATPAAAYELGFDLASWAEHGLVDGITTGAYFNTAWQIPVDDFRQVLGNNISLFVSTEASADRRDGLPERWLPLEPEMLRGFLSGYVAAGVDGIEAFNFFVPREVDPACQLEFKEFSAFKDPRRLRRASKTYLMSSGVSQMEADGIMALPFTLESAQTRLLEMWLGPEDEDGEAILLVQTEGGTGAHLWLTVNDRPVGTPLAALDSQGDASAQVARFPIAVPLLQEGKNRFGLRNEGASARIVGLELRTLSPTP